MEESQEIPDKPKRGRPRKAVEETALAIPEDDPPFQPVKKRTRKNQTRNQPFKVMLLLLLKRVK